MIIRNKKYKDPKFEVDIILSDTEVKEIVDMFENYSIRSRISINDFKNSTKEIYYQLTEILNNN